MMRLKVTKIVTGYVTIPSVIEEIHNNPECAASSYAVMGYVQSRQNFDNEIVEYRWENVTRQCCNCAGYNHTKCICKIDGSEMPPKSNYAEKCKSFYVK